MTNVKRQSEPTSAPEVTIRPVPSTTLLRGVSRSFYLSIRVLPAGLRTPIAAAYLLARATDTVADTAHVAREERHRLLTTLAAAVDAQPLPAGSVEKLVATLAPQQHDAAERALILALPACLAALEPLDPGDQADIRSLMRTITSGQLLDLERFSSVQTPVALASDAELLDYTWRVAGCVGEFWTDLCVRHLGDFADLPASEMRAIGRAFGMGLQLVNILCDAGADLAAGRCYFPADALAQARLEPASVQRQPERFMPLYRHWIQEADQRMDSGLRYAMAVRSRRVRAACALPALLGKRTLALLREAGPAALRQRVKVPRSEVRHILWRMAITLAGRESLARQVQQLAS